MVVPHHSRDPGLILKAIKFLNSYSDSSHLSSSSFCPINPIQSDLEMNGLHVLLLLLLFIFIYHFYSSYMQADFTSFRPV